MKESLLRLLDLQQIDSEIDKLRRSQEEYPDQIAQIERQLAQDREQIDQKKAVIADIEKSRRSMEGELETITADLKKHQDRLYEVKTNREYDALQHEIEALQSRVDEHETGILEGIEQNEDLEARLGEEEEIQKEQETEQLAEIKELQSQLDSVEDDVKTWETKRKAVEDQIERRALSAYGRIRGVVRGGVAVVQIVKGACGGCFRQLPPQRLVEVRTQERIIRCENCGRIVVWGEEA
ncbi:MAG: C4-type zinc ribbon domain-containing protein [Candidatus Latescibacteria bacterium]|nr:C4-type zinc ribbon domain-containing protein [Candidatus Latescibacterota bacterium]